VTGRELEQIDWVGGVTSQPVISDVPPPLDAPRLRPQQQAVLDAVRQWPGSTAVELAQHAALPRLAVSRRLPELAAVFDVVKGQRVFRSRPYVRRGPPRACRVTGSAQTTWFLYSRGDS
jgi:hypothetical protein